jgi:Amidohydrolase family
MQTEGRAHGRLPRECNGGERSFSEARPRRLFGREYTIRPAPQVRRGGEGLKIESKTGSLTPGKDADIILLDATALNVTPLNHAPGAVVTLIERSNVSTVLCAGRIKKWRGGIVGYDIPKLRAELEASRDHVFAAAGIERDLFRA